MTGSGAVSAVRELESHDLLSSSELRDLEKTKLRCLLSHAGQHVPYFKDVIHKTGLDIESLAEPTQFRMLPVLSKATIREQGERLPVNSQVFAPFFVGDENDELGVLLGCLEGVACVEAMVYELLEELGASVGGTIHATGGAAQSVLGLQIRSNLLEKTLRVPSHPNSAMGAAILAAAGFLERP